jgi:hypothetical protein
VKRALIVAVVAALALTACHDKGEEDEGPLPSCGAAPTALSAAPSLPAGFPTLGQLTFTGSSAAGPSTIVTGFWTGDLDSAYNGFKAAFPTAGYQVTHTEMDAHDAEVNFSGGDTSGDQVKLTESCQGRVDVSITLRPA